MKKLLLLLAAIGMIFTACQGGLDNEENGEMPTAQKKTIFYTSSDGNIVTPCRDYVFGARIVSNTYENGKGVIVFDAPVTSIGDYAFYYCTSLTSVTIPDSVTSIGNEAFGVCISLTSVYCKPTTPPAGGSDMFNNNAKGRKIYVPRNSVDAYKAAEYWSDYASYIEGYDF